MTSALSIEYINALRHAQDVLHIAEVRGYDIGEEWRTALTHLAEARRVADQPAPVRRPLTSTDSVEDYITSHGERIAAWRERRAVAGDVVEQLERDAARAAFAAAPLLAAQITTDTNTKLLPRLTELLTSAPRELNGYDTADAMAEHAELLRAAQDTARAAHDRAGITLAIGEAESLGRDGAVFLFIDPEPTTRMEDITAAIRRTHEGLPATVEDWSKLAAIGISFAAPGEAADRYDRYQTAIANGQFSADGGMLTPTRTFGEMLAVRRPERSDPNTPPLLTHA